MGAVFFAALNPANGGASDLVYSTYLGGNGNDTARGIALDSSLNVLITGYSGGNFPTTNGAYQTVFGGGPPLSSSDAFVAKFAMATPTNTPVPTATAQPPCNSSFYVSRNQYSPTTDQPQLFVRDYICFEGPYSVKIYNSAGEWVRTLVDISDQAGGVFVQKNWDGKNDAQAYVADGVYIIVMVDSLSRHMAKVVVVR
jgi:hypothetical protein